MHSTPRIRTRNTWATSVVTGCLVAVLMGTASIVGGAFAAPASADMSSAVTVTTAAHDAYSASAPLPGLSVTVSQTRNLISQGIVVSWTGGKKSTTPSGQTGGENFLQIAQCGGDDPENPGQPDRTTCQYGAFLTPGAKRDSSRASAEVVAPEDAQYTAPATGPFNGPYTSIPFTSATVGDDGKREVVASVVNNKQVESVNVNTNQFFTQNTSNEVSWAGSSATGSGSTKFEMQTAVQSPGLGCGAPVTASDGTVTGAPCWLVIIPRGTADGGDAKITQSGLFFDSWKHRLAVKLDFRPIGLRCAVGAAERQIAGSELVAGAVGSWQPTLCNAQGGSIYSILTGSESDAAMNANRAVAAPMALTSLPLIVSAGVTDSLAYAPIAVSGLAIGFAVDREPSAAGGASADDLARARTSFTEMKLTPRLVAKLLTSSYIDSLPYGADRSKLNYISAKDPGRNPRNITLDPDFLAINPDWANQALVSPSLSDLLVPQGRSDAATTLWNYIATDAAAAAWLAGTPDKWGMIVNPWSSTNATVNPAGVALEVPRSDFPKADPVEQPADGSVAPISSVTWRPFVNDLDSSAYRTLRGDGQVLGGWDSLAVPAKYTKTTRSLPGLQRVLGLTDTASAARYQVVTASLLNPTGAYIAPSTATLSAGAAAMTVSKTASSVYGFDPTSSAAKGAPTAYPLTMPIYAAVSPAMGDATLRTSYADFIRYAASVGQVPGAEIGQLPDGYAPLPTGWREQALAAAEKIQAGVPVISDGVKSPEPLAGSAATSAGVTSSAGSGSTVTPPGAAVDPKAAGNPVAALAGNATPADPRIGSLGSTIPLSLFAGILSALLVPIISRIRRRL
ncbi:hypothetical protein [Frigoribacterium sp. CG_9.8]|uniref:hypothetical protein n=1 Tax=Frigoribacterium sp. CG_9.8 TaxID=2787733 RepID=UPI0018CAB951|nr:hypothetical protein [Frigoribacterium sp. CG_9.8]MBG6108280.1 hypothetical protein [Frigoribacterium sp. CG_9.8]